MLVAPADEKQSSSVGAIYVPLLRSSISFVWHVLPTLRS